MTQSVKKRYAAKLAANLVGLIIGLFTVSIIPRGLGPKYYGEFSFLTDFFGQLISLFTLATSIGFYVKLSQRQNEFGLISFYYQFTGLAILVMFLFVGGSQITGASKTFWIDQSIIYVYMAAFYAALIWLVGLMTNVVDAYGLTISTEIAKIVQKFLGTLILLSLFLVKQLTLANFFLYNYIISVLLIVAFLWIITRNGIPFFQNWKLNKEEIKQYIQEFYKYSHPLFVYAIIGVFTGVFDRWLLQKYAGSAQQGYFGLSLQISGICFIFTSAMATLITREFAITYKNNDINEMARLFRRYIPMLYAVAAYFGCFVSVQASKIIFIFAGKQYANAVIPMAIMALYPIHQTYGQLSGSVFYATGKTKVFRNIGLFFMILGLPILYIALAPSGKMGFNAGATGLAIKFVLIQFIAVNVQLFYSSRMLKLRFIKYFSHQVICMSTLLGLALISKLIIDKLLLVDANIIISFLISGFIYSILVLLLIFFFPAAFGVYKSDVKSALKILSSAIGFK